MTPNPLCDLLIVSPHTDDLEIGLGGMAAVLAARGRKVWAVDLTRGELGSNATVAERWQEAAEASRILGLAGRLQLELPDGFVSAEDRAQRQALVWVLRALRPRWVVSAPDPVRHPDHLAGAELTSKAVFLSRLARLEVAVPPHHVWADGAEVPAAAEAFTPEACFHVCADDEKPALLFDVSEHWETKMRSLEAYASQFSRSEGRRATMINDAAFLEKVERRARTWGRQAGCEFAEALGGTPRPVLRDLPTGGWRS